MTYNFRKLQLRNPSNMGHFTTGNSRKGTAAINGRTVINPDVIQNDIDQNAVCFD
jgi:hypothetical protein